MGEIQGIQGRAGSFPDGQMSWPKFKGSSLWIHCTEADYMQRTSEKGNEKQWSQMYLTSVIMSSITEKRNLPFVKHLFLPREDGGCWFVLPLTRTRNTQMDPGGPCQPSAFKSWPLPLHGCSEQHLCWGQEGSKKDREMAANEACVERKADPCRSSGCVKLLPPVIMKLFFNQLRSEGRRGEVCGMDETHLHRQKKRNQSPALHNYNSSLEMCQAPEAIVAFDVNFSCHK